MRFSVKPVLLLPPLAKRPIATYSCPADKREGRLARNIKIQSGQINIALHPHDAGTYRSFIRDLYKLKKPVHLRGERYGILSLIHRDESDDGYISGVITTFTRLEPDGTWFDTDTLSEANTNKLSEINIPDHLYPNSAAFFFSFHIPTHRLHFQSYSKGKVLSVNYVLTLFEALANELSILSKYGKAKITAVQSEAGLRTLFAIPHIRRVRIIIQRPNPDVFGDDFESDIERELEKSNSRKVVIEFEAEAGKSIVPTASIMSASEAALENGKVEVSGRDENGRVEKSSEKFPRMTQSRYDPDIQSEEQAFRELIRKGAVRA